MSQGPEMLEMTEEQLAKRMKEVHTEIEKNKIDGRESGDIIIDSCSQLEEEATPPEPNRKQRRRLAKRQVKRPVFNSDIQVLREPDKKCPQCKGSGIAGRNQLTGRSLYCYCTTKKDYIPR